MDSESCLNFCCFPLDLRSLPCHVLFCGGDNNAIDKVCYDCLINFDGIENLCRTYFKRSNALVVKALDSQSRGPVFKISRWLKGRLSL